MNKCTNRKVLRAKWNYQFISLKKSEQPTIYTTAMRITPYGHRPTSFESPEDVARPDKTSLDKNRRQTGSESLTLSSYTLGRALQTRLLEQLQAWEPSKEKYLPFHLRPGYRGGYISSVGSSTSSVQVNVVSNVPYKEQSGNYGCWEACMNMIRAYFGAPPIGKQQLAFLYNKDGSPKPIDGQIDYKTRNKYANLINVPPPESKEWSVKSINTMLDKYGPVEALLKLDDQFEHNVVLVGIDPEKGKVLYHDPARGAFQSMSLDDFNTNFCWERYKSALTAYKG